jgi:hypothetical protein
VVATALEVGVEVGRAERSAHEEEKSLDRDGSTQKILSVRTFKTKRIPQAAVPTT